MEGGGAIIITDVIAIHNVNDTQMGIIAASSFLGRYHPLIWDSFPGCDYVTQRLSEHTGLRRSSRFDASEKSVKLSI